MTGSEDRYELRILGAPDLRVPDGRRVTSVLSQPSRLSLLAYLALAPGPVTRSSVVAHFWPESDETRARNALSQALFYLRRSLGKDAVRNVEGDRLWVPPERVWCDARELLTTDQPSAEVLAAADDELLAGWNAEESQPLQEWLDGLRRRVRERARALGENARTAAPPPPAAPGRSRPPARRFPWVPVLGGAAAVVVLVALLYSPGRGPEATGAAAAITERLVVLLPRVTVSAGAPELAVLTLNDQLLTRLPDRPRLEVVSAPYASTLQDLRSQLQMIDTPEQDMPDWILDVSVVVTADSVHASGFLFTGTAYSLAGRIGYDGSIENPAEALLAVPRAIAERVAEMVATETGAGA